jgi:hypothetical protein
MPFLSISRVIKFILILLTLISVQGCVFLRFSNNSRPVYLDLVGNNYTYDAFRSGNNWIVYQRGQSLSFEAVIRALPERTKEFSDVKFKIIAYLFSEVLFTRQLDTDIYINKSFTLTFFPTNTTKKPQSLLLQATWNDGKDEIQLPITIVQQ